MVVVMSEQRQRIKIDTFAGLFLVAIGFGLFVIDYDLRIAIAFVVGGVVFLASTRYRKKSLQSSDSDG